MCTAPTVGAIPGAVDDWTVIVRDHGKCELGRLLQAAIKAAEEGYVVAARIAFDWHNQFEKLKKGTNTGRYLLPHGRPAGAGDEIRPPRLGQTLRAVAQDGRHPVFKRAGAAREGRAARPIARPPTPRPLAAPPPR